jgi:hypothetical protein
MIADKNAMLLSFYARCKGFSTGQPKDARPMAER